MSRPTGSSFTFHGRSWKVETSGMAMRSLSKMRAKPSTEEPSMPAPSASAVASSWRVIDTAFSWPRMSTNQSWISSTSRSSQNFTTSLAVFRLSMLRGVLSPGVARGIRPAGRLAPEHHRHVALGRETELLVERVLILREKEEHRDGLEIGMVENAAHHLAADAALLVRVGHD